MSSAKRILDAAPAPPCWAIVLGSGLGALADAVTDPVALAYADLDGFPQPGVGGHAGRLVLGHLAGVPVAVLQGRAHYYEDGRADAMAGAIHALKEAGVAALLLTNAAGSVRREWQPGHLMLVSDHINFSGLNPLIGSRREPRFVDMSHAYDEDLRARFRAAADKMGIALGEGVYAWFSGPSFETPAEIKAIARLGADAVGMSTVPEAILARQAGLKVAAVSVITNLAAGIAGSTLDHADTLHHAGQVAADLLRLVETVLGDGA
ncbi:MAG: purine-nucleoside phosphorylase [Alphaproteobacteria bacterium]